LDFLGHFSSYLNFYCVSFHTCFQFLYTCKGDKFLCFEEMKPQRNRENSRKAIRTSCVSDGSSKFSFLLENFCCSLLFSLEIDHET
jgi:hypothetical protein